MFVFPTADAICLSLGLDGFEADMSRRTPAQVLRFLLCPTFHPEICLTFLQGSSDTVVHAMAARATIGSAAGVELAETDTAEGRTITKLAELGAAFCLAAGSGQFDGTARDGAVMYFAWRDNLARLKLEGANPAPRDALGLFGTRLVQIALEALPEGRCRARLAKVSALAEG